MELRLGFWLWLGVGVASSPPQRAPTGEAGYRLVRWPQGFPGVQAWGWLHGGSLLHSREQPTKGFLLRHNLNNRRKSWTAPRAALPQAREAAGGQGQSSAYQSIIGAGDQFWARKEACAKKLPFICQTREGGSHGSAEGPQRLRREAPSPQRRHLCTMRCSPRLRATAPTPGLTGEPATAPQSFRPGTSTHQQADGPTDSSRTPWGPTVQPMTGMWPTSHAGPELKPQTRPGHHLESMDQHQSGTQAESRVHLQPSMGPQGSPQPLQTPFEGPCTPEVAVCLGPGTQPQPTGKSTAKGPESSPPELTGGSVTLSPQDGSPEDEGQALEQLLCHFNQMVQSLSHPLAVERASQALQDLTGSPVLLSEDGQAQASHVLRFLSSQLPAGPLASHGTSLGSAAAASSLFQSLSNLLVAMSSDASGSEGSQQQRRAALAEMLAALPLIQTGLLLGSNSTEPSVTVQSPALTTTLSSHTASSLPHSSFHLPQPQPLTVTFPSASSLAPLLRQHGPAPVQVQVASFALDPFRPLGGKAMASVASIALRASEGPVSIHDLPEEMEITLGGEEEVEDSATQLNGSRGRFSMEVNITSLEDALLVSVRPTGPLCITLHLAPLLQAPSNCCLLSTTVPTGGWQEEGAYVWVVPPENLQPLGLGRYSLSAEVAPQSQGHGNFSVTIASTGCYHWASQEQAWRSHGCRVGPQSTLRRTQCLCHHLSFFGRLFVVVPHLLDLQRAGQLLSRVGQNPAGLALLCSLLLAYGVLLLWALRRQRADGRKVKVTALVENGARCCCCCCCYLVQVFTGYRRGAFTSANVVLTLYGAEGQSEPHLLQHPQAASLETGSMDAFLLTTQRPLGSLHAIRLWHDNSGTHPNWFVRRLVISDLAARKKWYFLCNCWLAADMEDGQVDKVFVAASDRELRSFGYLFWAGLVEKLTQEHLWLSVVTCSAWSPFTRVQRLSCCLALLLCSMLINIMFWKGPEEEEHPPGPLVVTWRDLVVSLEAALLLMPFQLLLVHIFQLVQPPALPLPPPLPPPVDPQLPQPASVPSLPWPTMSRIQQELMEAVGFLYKNPLCCCQDLAEFPGTWKQMPELVAGLCTLVRSSLQQLEESRTLMQERSSTFCGYLCHVVRNLEAQLRSLDQHHFQNPYDRLHALDQLRRLQQQLQQQQNPQPGTKQPSSQLSSFQMEEQRGPCSGGLPRRFHSLCWLVVGTAGLVSGFFTVLYSLKLSRAQATRWVTSMVLSGLQGILLMQPLKILALTLVFALTRKKELGQDKGQERVLQQALALIGQLPPAAPGSRDGATNSIYRPPPLQPAAPPKEGALKEKKLYSLVREIVVQLTFLAVLMVLCYAERSPSEFYLNDALRKTFFSQVGNIQNLEQLYGWAQHTLLPSIYRDSEGFDVDTNTFLVGSVRLRQIRAEEGPDKLGPAFFWPQHKPYAASRDDGGRSGPCWSPSDRAQEGAWAYQSETTLQEYPTRGKFAVYPGGGYLADLGRNTSYANRILRDLAQEKWLDRCTRAVFVEFTVYNANVNLFCAVTVMLETNGIGALASSTALQVLRLYPNNQMLVPLACAQLIFLVLLLYYIVVQGQCLKQQRWRDLCTKGNILDAFSIFISLMVVGLYVRRGLLAASILRQHRQDRSRFFQVSEMANTDAALTYLIAFLVALTTIKLCNLLRLNPRMHLITRTLQKAWDEILGFLLTLLVLLIGYAFACNLLFGWSIISFKTFSGSAVTIVGLLAGICNYEAVIALDPVLGFILLVTSILSMVFVILNLFVSALLTIFSREMKAVKVSKEESMMQLIQLKISSLLGIKQWAPEPAFSRAAEE